MKDQGKGFFGRALGGKKKIVNPMLAHFCKAEGDPRAGVRVEGPGQFKKRRETGRKRGRRRKNVRRLKLIKGTDGRPERTRKGAGRGDRRGGVSETRARAEPSIRRRTSLVVPELDFGLGRLCGAPRGRVEPGKCFTSSRRDR